jgi:hypothetical protein
MPVPVPGLFVFTAGAYKISIGIDALGRLVGWIVFAVVGAYFLGRLADRLELRGCGPSARMRGAWRRFTELSRHRRPNSSLDAAAPRAPEPKPPEPDCAQRAADGRADEVHLRADAPQPRTQE